MAEDNTPSWVLIDKYKLDDEWVRQPQLALRFADKLAEAERELDRCKSVLEITEAEIALDIRANPKKYQMTKETDSAVEIRVKLHVMVQEAKKVVFDAKEKAALYKARVSACEHKKKALDGLTYLQGQTYFGTMPKKHKREEDD